MRLSYAVSLLTLILLLAITMLNSTYFDGYWGLISLLFLFAFMAEFIFIFNDSMSGAKDIALISILGSFSAASRIPFAGIPSVQPSTFIIIMTGYTLGYGAGFMVGLETALLSNFILGQGPWTPWQMLAWGITGILGASIRRFRGGKYEGAILLGVSVISGYLFGAITNLWYWLAFISPHTLASFLMVESLSIYFDTMHAVGNFIFMDLFGPKFADIMERFKLKTIFLSAERCPE